MRCLLLATALMLGCSGPKPPPVDGGGADASCSAPAPARGECRRDADCASGHCVADGFSPATDGDDFVLVCVDAAPGDDASCALGADCAHGLCLVSGACAVPCAAEADCPAGDACQHVWATRAEASPPVEWSTQAAWACVPRVVLGTPVSVERLPNAAHLTPEARTVSLSLGEQPAISVLLTSCGLSVYAKRLLGAGGDELFGPTARVASAPPLNPIVPRAQPLTLLIPSGFADVSSPGGYLLELEGEGEGDLELITLGGGSDAGGELTLELFYVGVPGWSPTGLEPPPEVAAALTEATRLFGASNVTLRVVGQHVVPGALASRLAVIDEEPDGNSPEREELFGLSAGLRSASLPVFFVRAMDRGALGASGGIPGPQGVMATRGSGVVLAASIIGDERLSLGAVLAHEVAHFLGLFHTSESGGGGVEALMDTPICDGARDTDGDGFYSAAECAGSGAENLMFWSARAGGEVLTAEQAGIVRRAPLLQH